MSLTIEKLGALDEFAFEKTDSVFYSCNTGTLSDGKSFAQEWSNITNIFGGKTKAAIGKTWYGDINSRPGWRGMPGWLFRRGSTEIEGGYKLPYPAFSEPTLYGKAEWKTFETQWSPLPTLWSPVPTSAR